MEALGLGHQPYSRKEKSLGLLVSNFLKLYNRDGVDLIGLDDAAGKLGVERRRIYDVVNILESIGLVARRGKNQYSWRGFGEVPRALAELKEEGMKEKFGVVPFVTKSEMVLYEEERQESFKLTPEDQDNSPSLKLDNKKERSLWQLSQSFVKLFLCSDDDLITLDGATKALLNDPQDPTTMRTKVRRLYDIANVFSSMNLIEKTHIPETKKAAYRWLGSIDISENKFLTASASSSDRIETKKAAYRWLGSIDISENKFLTASASSCDRIEPKKRAFGTEITNFSAKRNKANCSKDRKHNGKQNTSRAIKEEPVDVKPDVTIAFGSSTPAGASGMNNLRPRLGVIEALSSMYQPQYCNPALFGLLAHYKETFESCKEEFGRK
ncbi:PREDICTED: E2F transcription factor-like E2FD [Camelina sativa]|uniref:E2F transcription factor-like E2FD n=1 Tax=Camelina sativa TaxID=90675 RepID=A0ABM0VB79_CAMSA|nr:PREDICTED: E2F transcription factor-like E2FD [Camelina sativa]